MIAIISLATVNSFSTQATRLLHEVFIALSTRVEGVLALRKIREISDKLELQNNELELQKTELITQSARLTAQNTELEIQKKELAEASRLKTNFLSNMSHELRTPLNSVIALTGVLSRRLAGKIPEEEHSYLQVIERNGKNLLALINDILDISRIESGREELEMTRFDVNELITESINLINPQARQKNVELKFTPGVTVLNMTTDAEKLSHILQNLIGNAVKFTEQGMVTVKTDESNDQVFITVTDTGIGIAEYQLPYIFDEFRQADSSTSRRFGGTGLGLALARKYTRLLGGEISVRSTLNQGSEFTLSLPLKYNPVINKGKPNSPASLTFMIDQPAREQEGDFKSKSVLLVEDSEPAIIQIKDLMEDQGINILIARDGQEALDLISQNTPDAMILDLMMPGIDGFQVLKAVRESEITSHLPVLILTAKFVTKSELSFLKANNIHQLIRKGDVNLEELVRVVKEMLTGGHQPVEGPLQESIHEQNTPLVLVVEDNPDNMLAANALLEGKFKVLGAKDGFEGVKMAKEYKPIIILMDIELPGMSGIEAFKKIRKDPELMDIPVIALTASAMARDQETILAHGFDAYIAKPIDESTFFGVINRTLYGQ